MKLFALAGAATVVLGAPGAARAQDPTGSSVPCAVAASAAATETSNAASCCRNYGEVLQGVAYPRAAYAARIYAGRVVFQFIVGPNGEPIDIVALESTHRAFVNEMLPRIQALRCNPANQGATVRIPFDFKVR